MPMFEYVCAACGRAFETLVFGKRDVVCPACGSAEVTKQLSAFAVSKSDSTAVPACGAEGCGIERGGCGSGLCGHAGRSHG